jgi:hypothetical protein
MDKAQVLYTKYKTLFQESNLQLPNHEQWFAVIQCLGIVLRQREQILKVFREAHEEYWMENHDQNDVWHTLDPEVRDMVLEAIYGPDPDK